MPDLNFLKSLQDAANDASSVAKNKIEAAVKARDEAVRKALVARKAVELARDLQKKMGTAANPVVDQPSSETTSDQVEALLEVLTKTHTSFNILFISKTKQNNFHFLRPLDTMI